jgi:hypothetical protein
MGVLKNGTSKKKKKKKKKKNNLSIGKNRGSFYNKFFFLFTLFILYKFQGIATIT